jgi:hypothetical protein
MAGYTRQSTFADGDTITAALFNNEYNQLLNAFSSTSGHKHDGTANEGPVIGLIGDAGETSPNNKVLIDTTNNYIEFYVEVSSAPVQQLYIADGAIVPVTDSDVDLGTTSLRFKDTYTDTITTTGNVDVGGNLTVTGTTTFNGGTITMGDAATDNVVFGADVDSNIIPDDDDSYDLGSSSQEWRNLYIDGTANIDSLVADTADINGGTIDGSTIATSDITVGAGKTLDVSSGTLTLADNQISGDKVEGGTIAATTITSLTATSADINGGTIDGVTIGGTSAGAVNFTDLSDGTITITAFADEDDMSSDSATLVPTQQSVKAYVDSQVTAQDLDFQGDTGGALSIDLDSESLTIAGGTGLDTVGSGNTVTVNIDSTVATLTGTQTLTNKTLTTPVISSISNTGTLTLPTSTDTLVGRATTDTLTNKTLTSATLTSPVINTGVSGTAFLDDDTFATATASTLASSESIKAYVDTTVAATNEVVEDTTPQLGGDLDLNSNDITGTGNINITGTIQSSGNITGTLATAAQPNITSVGSLTALDVTGTATMDGLTVDGSLGTFAVDTQGVIVTLSRPSTSYIRASDASGALRFDTGGSVARLNIANNGDISFYNTAGTSQALFWDASAESLGIGSTSVRAKLDIVSSTSATPTDFNASSIFIEETGNNKYAGLTFLAGNNLGNTGTVAKLLVQNTNTAGGFEGAMIFSTRNSSNSMQEAMRIDNNQNLLVGKTAPTISTTGVELRPNGQVFATQSGNYPLLLNRTTSDGDIVQFRKDGTTVGSIGSEGGDSLYIQSGTTSGSGLHFHPTNAHVLPAQNGNTVDNTIDLGRDSKRFKDLYLSGSAFIDTQTRLGGGSAATPSYSFSADSDTGMFRATTNTLGFSTAGLERMRLDSSGNLLVGTTDTTLYNDASDEYGIVFEPTGESQFSANNRTLMYLNRQNGDGTILDFRKDGTAVGSINSYGGTYLFIGSSGNSSDTYLGFYNATVRPVNASGTNRDNVIDLGTSSARFDDVYATNGTIQTSDRNEKQDIAELTDAETRVAVASKGLLRKFRWQSAVEEKGDEARTHFGIIAQDLQDAFTAEGLDAGDYAMFISSTWTDDDGVEQTRLGVRYSELLAFIIAAI